MISQDEKDRKNAMARARYKINPHARRAGNNRSIMKARYGITPEQKKDLLDDQGGKCAICSIDEPRTATGWHIDHCHSEKKIRGILCQHCNNMLGMAHDKIETLIRAAEYLKRNK